MKGCTPDLCGAAGSATVVVPHKLTGYDFRAYVYPEEIPYRFEFTGMKIKIKQRENEEFGPE